jgi:hypothetical protein
MNADQPEVRCVHASMTDRDPLQRSDNSGRKPQIATVANLPGRPRPVRPIFDSERAESGGFAR